MTKKLLQSFKNIWLFVFNTADSESLYQYEKKSIRNDFDENIKSKFKFSIIKKNLNKIEIFIIFVLWKNQTAKNQLYKTEKNQKRKRMINKSWRKNEDSLNIVTIATVSFNVLSNQKNVKIFAIFLKNINYEMKKKIVTDSKNMISKKYHDFLNVFFKQKTDKFSFYRK